MKRYLHSRILAVLLLGISSGVPRALVGGTLAAWLFESNVSLTAIGFSGYIASPYIYKFLWAPVMDQVRLPWLTRRFGQRVGWMLVTQLGVMAALAGMALTDPAQELALTVLLAIAVAFFSASQDVVIDAYRAEYLPREQYAEGAASGVLGYRVGMLLTGAGALILSDHLPWMQVYLLSATLILGGMVTVLIAGEPAIAREEPVTRGAKAWLEHSVVSPFRQFMQTQPQWIWLLLFILLYRLPDGFIGTMTTPFQLAMGFTKTDIGTFSKLYGFLATAAGAFLGSAFYRRAGLRRTLFWFGLWQGISNLGYLLLVWSGPQLWALAVSITLENLVSGALGSVMALFFMQLCDTRYTATQYALLSALAAVASIYLAGPAGWMAERFGWEAMFGFSALLSLPAVLLLRPLHAHPLLQKPESKDVKALVTQAD